MPSPPDNFYRIQKLPPYVFAVINEMKAKARAAQIDVIDLGMGNPDGATPRAVVNKLIEAARNPRNHRYSQSRGHSAPARGDRQALPARTTASTLDPEKEAIVTIGAKDALAHLLFATIGPGDVVVSPNPAYPIHQYGVIMAEGQACMLPMPDAATFPRAVCEDLYRSVRPKPEDAADLVPAQPHHHLRGPAISSARSCAWRAQHGTMIVHDFAYADLGFDGYKPPSILQVEGAKEVAVEIFSHVQELQHGGLARGLLPGQSRR